MCKILLKYQGIIMKSYKTLLIVMTVTACLMLGFGYGEQGNTYTLKYSTEAGKTFNYSVSGSGEQEIDAMGNIQSVTSTSDGKATVKVVKAAGGKITFDMSFTEMSAIQESDMDSQDADLSESIGTSLILETGERGENPNLTNVKDLPVPEGNPVPLSVGLMGLVIELPDKPVKINDTWTSIQKLDFETAVGTVTSETNYNFTLAGTEQKNGFDCVKITGKAEGKSTGSAVAQGMDFDMEIEDNSTFTIFFAHKEGVIVELEGNTNSEIIADIAAVGMTITISASENTKIIIVK